MFRPTIDMLGAMRHRPIFPRLLIAGFLAVSACASSSVNLSTTDPAPVTPRVGVQLYSFRKQLAQDLDGTLAKIAAMGFTSVETHTYFERTPAEFASLLTKHGLQAVGISATLSRLRDDPQSLADEAKILGARYAACFYLLGDEAYGSEYTHDENLEAISIFTKAGKVLKQSGVQLVFHPHGFEFTDGGRGDGKAMLDVMIESTDAAVVQFEMDVYWIVNAGRDPVDYLKRYPGRFKLFHLKDMKDRTGTPRHDARTDIESQQVAAGTGVMDFAAIFKAAEAQGADWYFIEDESSRSIEQVPQSLAYLRRVAER
jgi:sugar phosphate isomerase/epimerase